MICLPPLPLSLFLLQKDVNDGLCGPPESDMTKEIPPQPAELSARGLALRSPSSAPSIRCSPERRFEEGRQEICRIGDLDSIGSTDGFVILQTPFLF